MQRGTRREVVWRERHVPNVWHTDFIMTVTVIIIGWRVGTV